VLARRLDGKAPRPRDAWRQSFRPEDGVESGQLRAHREVERRKHRPIGLRLVRQALVEQQRQRESLRWTKESIRRRPASEREGTADTFSSAVSPGASNQATWAPSRGILHLRWSCASSTASLSARRRPWCPLGPSRGSSSSGSGSGWSRALPSLRGPESCAEALRRRLCEVAGLWLETLLVGSVGLLSPETAQPMALSLSAGCLSVCSAGWPPMPESKSASRTPSASRAGDSGLAMAALGRREAQRPLSRVRPLGRTGGARPPRVDASVAKSMATRMPDDDSLPLFLLMTARKRTRTSRSSRGVIPAVCLSSTA
jgi:hypothetical protein